MDSPLASVAQYYSEKIRRYGPTPEGVDWNNAEGQRLRFDTLLQICPSDQRGFSLDDYGCGYGALLDHVRKKTEWCDYLGFDVSSDMIEQAKQYHPKDADRFHLSSLSLRIADFAVASGIFNVPVGVETSRWERHIRENLDAMNANSRLGFSFNCLTSYSDPDRQRTDLYYGNPGFYFDLCKRAYSKNVALLHDYGLYEFTILVRKSIP